MKILRYGLLPLALFSAFSIAAIAQDAPADSPAPASDAPTTTPDAPAPAPESAPSSGDSSSSTGGAPLLPDLFDDRFYIAPMASFASTPSHRDVHDGIGGRVAFGKPLFPHLSIELLGAYLHYNGKSHIIPGQEILPVGPTQIPVFPDVTVRTKNQKVYGGGAGANLYLSPSNQGLFLTGDAMAGNRFVYDGGLGYDIGGGAAELLGFDIRLEALYHKERQFKGEPLFNLGIRMPFGKLPAPAVAPEPPPVVVPVEAPPPPPPPPPCEMPAAGQPINMEGCKTGDTLVLRGVNFDFNKSSLTANAKTILDQVADALSKRTDIKVDVDGHTDGIGSVAYNQKLSERRAASVVKYLVGKGIDAGRMTPKGFGKSMPIADNKTDEGRELNRRVELKVTDSGGSTEVPVSSGAMENTAAPAAAPPADTPATPPPAPTDAGEGKPE